MATVIDALIVTLGLDGRGVTKGQKSVTGDMRRVEKQADHTGKTVADSGKAMGDSFRSVRTELLGLFALMTAGRGLKDFISSTTASNVAAGQLSHNLGMSTQTLTAWQKVAESTGGSASDMASSMQSVVSQFQTIEGRRNLAQTFQQMGVSLTDAKGNLRDFTSMLPDLAAASQRMSPAMFSALAGQAGFGQGTINMLEQGPEHIRSLYEALRKYAPTEADARASAQLLEDWTKLTAQSEAFGRTIMTDLSPEVHDLFQFVSQLIDRNQDWIRQDIDQYAKGIGDAIKSTNWQQVGREIEDFASSIGSASHDMGGFVHVTEALLALWTGERFASMLTNAGKLGATLSPGGLLVRAAMFAGYEGYQAGKEIIHDTSDEGKRENRRKIYDRHDPYYSYNRYSPLEQNQIQHALFGYGVNQLHRDPRDVAAMLAQFKAESGFNPQAIGDHGNAIGMAQWQPAREKWVEQQAGKSITSMDWREQMKWAFAELDHMRLSGMGGTAAQRGGFLSQNYEKPADKEGQANLRSGMASRIYANETGIPEQIIHASAPPAQVNNTTTNSVGDVHFHIQSADPKGAATEVQNKMSILFRNNRLASQAQLGPT